MFRSPVLESGWLGQPWHSLTANDHYVFGVTTSPLGLQGKSKEVNVLSSLWSLDLRRDGALAMHRPSKDANVTFVGAPIVQGTRLYVPVRSNDQTARAGIVLLRPRYQRADMASVWLCQANTPATGRKNEIASSLLTYDSGILYANTNLGAVRPVRADDGKVLWLRTYQRKIVELDGERNCAYYRGPSPCVYCRGVVVALPTDSKSLLILDASTGKELWRLDEIDATLRIDSIVEGRLVLNDQGLQAYALRTGKKFGQQDNLWDDLPFAKQSHILSDGEYVIAAGKSQLSVLQKSIQNGQPFTRRSDFYQRVTPYAKQSRRGCSSDSPFARSVWESPTRTRESRRRATGGDRTNADRIVCWRPLLAGWRAGVGQDIAGANIG